MSKLICVGNATWDQTFLTKSIQDNATKCYAEGFRENGGGVAATASVAVAGLGHHAYFIGRLGEDFVGDRILDELHNLNVDTSHSIRYPQAKSSIATIILSDNGSSKIYVYNDNNMPRDTSQLFDIDLSGVVAIVADMTWPEAAQVLFERSKQYKIPTLLRVNFYNSDYQSIMELADVCVFNHPSLLAMTSDIMANRSLRKVQKRIGGSIVVTRGNRGCAWLHGEEFGDIPGQDLTIVNSTGAGDVFIGALATALGNDVEFSSAVAVANQLAMESCLYESARDLPPTELSQLID